MPSRMAAPIIHNQVLDRIETDLRLSALCHFYVYMSESVNIKAVSGSGHADHSNALSYCLLNTIPQITSTYYL